MEELKKIIEILEYEFSGGPDAMYRGGFSPRIRYFQIMRPENNVLEEMRQIFSSGSDPSKHLELRKEYEQLTESYSQVVAEWQKVRWRLWVKRFLPKLIFICASIFIGCLLINGIANVDLGLRNHKPDIGALVAELVMKYVLTCATIGGILLSLKLIFLKINETIRI